MSGRCPQKEIRFRFHIRPRITLRQSDEVQHTTNTLNAGKVFIGSNPTPVFLQQFCRRGRPESYK